MRILQKLITDVTQPHSQAAKRCLERKKIQRFFWSAKQRFAPCERGCVTPVIKSNPCSYSWVLEIDCVTLM